MIRTTFSIPNEMKDRLDKRPEVNWPEVFKRGLKKKLKKLEELHAKGEI